MTISEKFLKESTFNGDTYLNNIIDSYKLMRWFYKIGHPIIEDSTYDELHKEFLKHEAFNTLTDTNYEDDVFPKESFEVFGVEVKEYQIEENKYVLGQTSQRMVKWGSELDDEESKSIFPIESVKEAFQWFLKNNGHEKIISLKVDGINTKNLYEAKQLTATHRVSATRSRNGSGLDVTENMGKIIPQTFNLKEPLNQSLFVRGEAYVPSKSLEYLRDKYKQPYKIPRSTAMSAMRVGFDNVDMHHLKLLVFKTGLGNTVEEGYLTAEELGFTTPPYIKVNKDFYSEYEFELWITNIQDEFYKKGIELDIPSDGLVAQLNDLTAFKDQGEFGNYNHGAVALKFNQWSSDVYQSTVEEIIVEPNKEKFSYVARIKPITIKSGITVSRVNIFNARVMIDANINVGKPIKFEYKSESSVNLIY